MGAHSQGLFRFRPVTFRYQHDPQGLQRYGLIAEEVITVYPELVIWGPMGTWRRWTMSSSFRCCSMNCSTTSSSWPN
jgi:Chaperone of endosialidase